MDAVPVNHGPNVTTLRALSAEGIEASMVVVGATTKEVFEAFVEHVLVPVLRPGMWVLLDNLAAHRSPKAEAMVKAKGARLVFLPPYSPDFSPIEKAWSKIKALVRRAKARTQQALIDALANAIARVSASDAHAWFSSCGYRIS